MSGRRDAGKCSVVLRVTVTQSHRLESNAHGCSK